MDVQKNDVLHLLMTKSVMKQDIFYNTIEAFELFRKISEATIEELKDTVTKKDKRVTFYFKEFNVHSFQIKIAGDILQFDMHTNVFRFPDGHPAMNHSRIKKNPELAFCGIISVYNFMADSFKYSRVQDIGILSARFFINKEKNILSETRYPSGYRMGNFTETAFSEDIIKQLLNNIIYAAIEHDLTVPPFHQVIQVTVSEIQEKANSTILRTGKRLGFGSQEQDNFFEDTKL